MTKDRARNAPAPLFVMHEDGRATRRSIITRPA
jgi:hypothetical protein